ncbi:MAG TPA: hypothetical protein VFB26_11900 [Gaiellaceae bacterium]|nr:hypothetical protein [Gaiellaceae bacterium]
MRKLLVIGLAVAGLLGAAGVAVAHLTSDGVAPAAATFNATRAEHFSSRTCTGPDGQYQLLDAVFSGSAASGDARLAGDLRVRIHSVYNTTEKSGWATGWLKLRDSGAIRFDAVNTNGKLTGFARGRLAEHVADVLGAFTADFSSAGLANGQLGGGGSAPNVAVLAGRICTGPTVRTSVRLTVKGTISSISSAAVSVAPEDGSPAQTCSVGPRSPSLSGFATGQKVEMRCETVGGTLTVVRLKKRGET